MNDRIFTGLWLAAAMVIAITNKILLLTVSCVILLFILYEVRKKNTKIEWGSTALIHAFGIFMANSMSPTEIFFVGLVTASNDVFAYYGGKHWNLIDIFKLNIFPKISPNKTFGGYVYGLLFGSILGAVFNSFFSVIDLSINHTLAGFMAGLVIAIFACAGDLLESKFKRENGIKDSGENLVTGRILKGHGGFYDRFDAIAMAIWGWYLLKYILI